MSDYLLAAIREQPDDDLARLAHADFLDENGGPDRAHFIRLQMAAEQQPACSPRAGELSFEAEGVLAAHERRWLGEWADLLVGWTFRRGFLDSATLTPELFLTRGGELFGAHPIREVRFVGDDGEASPGDVADELVASKAFARVRAVNASGARPSAGPAWCRALARATHLTRIEELNFGNAWHHDAAFDDLDALRSLCEAEHLRSLRKLDLSSPLSFGGLDDGVVEPLLGAPFFPHLTDLTLGGLQLSDGGLRALISGRRLALEGLSLSWCERLTHAGLQALYATKNLPRLSTLGLGGDLDVLGLARSRLLGQIERLDLCTAATNHGRSVTPDEWAELAASPRVGRLRRLSILYSFLDQPGCEALFATPGPLSLFSLMLLRGTQGMAASLAASPALRTLTAVELVACGFGAEQVKTILAAPFVPNLRLFCVAGNAIGTRGLYAMLSSPLKAGRLEDLHLHHCTLFPGALEKLFAWPGLANVTRLEMGANELRADAMAALLASRHLGKLTALHLSGGGVTEDALLALARSAALPRLRDVTVSGGASGGTVAALRERFGARLKLDARG